MDNPWNMLAVAYGLGILYLCAFMRGTAHAKLGAETSNDIWHDTLNGARKRANRRV